MQNPKTARNRSEPKASMQSWSATRFRPLRENTDDLQVVLQRALAKFPSEGESLQLFEKEFRSKLTRQQSLGSDNVFHIMAGWQGGPWSKQQRGLFNWLLKEQPKLLAEFNRVPNTPIHLALENGHDEFVKCVLDAEPDNIVTTLECKSLKGNCFHLAVENGFPYLEDMIKSCGLNLQMLELRNNESGDTPLHLAVKKLAMDEIAERLQHLTDRLKDENEGQNDEAEYQKDGMENLNQQLVELKEWEKYERDKLQDVLAKKSVRPRPAPRTATATLNGDQVTHHQQPETNGSTALSITRRNTEIPVDSSAAHEQQQDIDDSLDIFFLSVVKSLVPACPAALGIQNADKRTPYQQRESTLSNSPSVKEVIAEFVKSSKNDEKDTEQRAQRKIFVEDSIAAFIRSYCMRNSKSRAERMSRLYQSGQERHVEFDLAGIPTSVVPTSYLDQLATHVKFESILNYVALPNLTIEAPQHLVKKAKIREAQSQDSAHQREGRSHLIPIFDWLWHNGVREIIKVMVVDDKDPPHTDSAIIEALHGFKVEEWDWKRIDLSSDVIFKSSLFIKEACLYASGNHAVMMGWASSEGLGNREKFPKLERVNIFVRKGLEDQDTLEGYTNDLADAIEKHAGKKPKSGNGKTGQENRVKVKIIPDNNKVSFSSEILNWDSSNDETPDWIKCIEDFGSFIKNGVMDELSSGRRVGPVKIAIIDDGIDATISDLQNQIVGGATFYPYPHSPDLMNPYFVSSRNHGTLMAQLICSICPDVQLYIARLEELPTTQGRRVTARSATKALEWAKNCGVDIISMSWTIQTTLPDSTEMNALREAIRNCDKAEILMFCSASDRGSHAREKCYPGEWNECLRIGAATFTGEKLQWVENDVEFWFPGRNVPFRSGATKSSIIYESGSSVATAAASGLAGALIYAARLLGGDHASSFRKRSDIMQAFEKMSTGDERKFPRTEEVFRKRFVEKVKAQRPRGMMNPDVADLDWDRGNQKALEELLNWIKDK